MLKSYVSTAVRHLSKNRSTTIINIIGLALGIACLLVILTVVRYERSYDQFHSNAERIYRIVRMDKSDSGDIGYRTGISYPLTTIVKEELATVREATATLYVGGMPVSIYHPASDQVGRQFREESGVTFVDSAFFRVFDFHDTDFRWIAGDPETALREPFTAIITQTLADKYFLRENPLGQTLRLDNLIDVTVTGVVTDLPSNSDLPFRIMVSYETLKSEALFKDSFSDWYSVSDEHQVYVLLNENTRPGEVDAQIYKAHEAQVGKNFAQSRWYKLQPLSEVHTDGRFGNYRSRTVGPEMIGVLLIIGIFIMSTAGINFVNLSTAQSVLRSKEVGIRKTLGSLRSQLIFQFLGETLIITGAAGILALGAAELVMVHAGHLLQIATGKTLLSDPYLLVSLAFIVVGVALLAGAYPALMLSGFDPVAALKNKLGGSSPQGMRLRRGLVTLQFVIAQVFIIGTIVVIRQIDYFREADLGFEQEAIIAVKLPWQAQPPSTLETLKNQWKTNPAVQTVSLASTSPAGMKRNTSHWSIRRKGAAEGEEGISFERQSIDEAYFGLFRIPLIAGRNFSPTDTLPRIILNRRLSERLGFTEPAQGIDETVLIGGDTPYTVIGVVENFHTQSLKEEIDYVGFMLDPRQYYTANIQLNLSATSGAAGRLAGTLQQLQDSWSAAYPEYMFDYQFLDESIAAYYREETRLSQLFKILVGITIFIGCLGLYGLVAFMALRRTKEVGIRKVLGASVRQILVLFYREFIVLILLAFCIAGPIAFYIMRQWLQNFTYQIDIGIGIFLVAIAASLIITFLTVSYQSIQAATMNPVESLRNE